MTDAAWTPATLARRINALGYRGRRLFAVAGPPASGKSTFAAALTQELGTTARLVPMDGFHLSNTVLEAKGLRARKGAPETFDLPGLHRLIGALRSEPVLYYPIFDRRRDLAEAGAGEIDVTTRTVIIEGNYLMFDEPGWRELACNWDGCTFLDVAMDVLRDRLLERWRAQGETMQTATRRAEENDLPNARRVLDKRLRCETEILR
ncbi:hypothetical protein E4Z66_13665 [Aliishimia ponticola]|uniref:Nucleoside/nucleotide kinase family protein n=1 Tax=Aliishimia ponticola TaxID=2499833 RepID=A0A4S4NJ40_9RHOB|nr:hypothetical protein [Aliishimia ponticola]THH36100.1 hypothetical protein E4Z66_13665 [Aliishimia ponticola]